VGQTLQTRAPQHGQLRAAGRTGVATRKGGAHGTWQNRSIGIDSNAPTMTIVRQVAAVPTLGVTARQPDGSVDDSCGIDAVAGP
jgi:hypothetical protein